MVNMFKLERQLEKEDWTDHLIELQEQEQETLAYTLNKSYNRKGLTVADYNNNDYIY